jgi:hypothetical protein
VIHSPGFPATLRGELLVAQRQHGRGPVVTKTVESGKHLHCTIVGGKKSSARFRSDRSRMLTAPRGRDGSSTSKEVAEKKERARTASAVKTFAQTLRTSALSRRLSASEEQLRGVLAWTARELR